MEYCCFVYHFCVEDTLSGELSKEDSEMLIGDVNHGCNGNAMVFMMHCFLIHLSVCVYVFIIIINHICSGYVCFFESWNCMYCVTI